MRNFEKSDMPFQDIRKFFTIFAGKTKMMASRPHGRYFFYSRTCYNLKTGLTTYFIAPATNMTLAVWA